MPFKFYLADLYTRTEITEPEGWKDVKNVIERDFSSHGMFSNYTDGTLKLGFVCEAATLLEAEYIENGVDSYYLFEVEEAPETSSIYTVIFSAEVDFTTRDYDEDFFKAEVNNSNTFLKVKNRADKKIALNFQQTLDGSDRNRINYNDNIHSLAIKDNSKFVGTNSGETLDGVQSDDATTNTYMVGSCGFLAVEDDEIKKSSDVDSFIQPSDTGDIRLIDRTPILVMERDGALFIEYDFDIDIEFTPDQFSGSMTFAAQIALRFDKIAKINVNANPGFVESLDNDTLITSDPYGGSINLAATSSRMATVSAGTKVSIDLLLSMQTTGTAQFTAVLDITNYNITITDKIARLPTTARWYKAHDAINKHLDFLTNDSNFLYSELLGDQLRGYSIDGCLSDLVITNGYKVRQINDDDKTPVQSLKDFTENLRVLGAAGWGIEEIDSATQIGHLDVFWLDITGDVGRFYIYDNMAYDISIGDSIGFYNSEVLFGVYEVTDLVYNVLSDRTTIYIDISVNPLYGDGFGFIQANPSENTWYYDTLVTNNSILEERERFRVEKWDHFYGDKELINLGTVQKYTEAPFNEAIYNSVKIGFSKYANDEDKSITLDEFETESEWSLPVVKSDNKLNLITKWIGSTFLFNESRERIFLNRPTTSHKLDKNIFFSTTSNFQITSEVDFLSGGKTVTFDAATYENYIANSGFFNVLGATDAGNNGQYTIDTTEIVLHDIENDLYIVTMSGSRPTVTRNNETVNISVVFIARGQTKIEANENMIQTTGLTLPAYMMNQRNTIKRFLFRWGSFINSSIAYFIQTTSKTIRNLFYDVNGDFSSEIDTYDLDADCVNVQGLVQENANVNTDDLDNLKFAPNLINGLIEVCDDDYNNILDAHKGKGSTPYGFFTLTTPNNELKQGWLLKMRRSPIDRIAEFQLLERYNPPMIFDGTNYGEVDNNAAFQITDFKFTMIVTIADVPTSPTRYSLTDSVTGVGSGWHFNITQGSIGVAFADGAALNNITGSNELGGNNTYEFWINKVGLNYTAGFDSVTILDRTLSSDLVAPTANFLFGKTNGQSWPLTGNVKLIRLQGLDGSGNIISEVMRYEGANDNGIRVLNSGEDAPANTNMIWK